MILIHEGQCLRNFLDLEISFDPDLYLLEVTVRQELPRKKNPLDPSLLGTHKCSSAEEMYKLYEEIASQLFGEKNDKYEFEFDFEPLKSIDLKKWHENFMENSRKLFEAVTNNDLEAIKPWLGREGEDIINHYNQEGETPLTLAVKLNHKEAAYELLRSMLLEKEAKNRAGKNPVEIAIEEKNKEMVRTLLSMGWLSNEEERLGYILQSGLELPDPQNCTLNMAELVLEKAPDLSDEQKNAYRERIDYIMTPEPKEISADFDIGSMADEYAGVISDLADKSGDTVFAAFAIDGGICSLATVEEIEKELRPPDWSFHHELNAGFDFDAYNEHYEASDEEQKSSAYTVAMKEFLKELEEREVFKKLNRTDNFSLSIVEHEY
jgi:ankyrin repeat protein